MDYDVIVVGLGPAGATAAYELSKTGCKVLGLEKQQLPRYKPCAGGLSLKIEHVLLFPDWREQIENTVYDLILSYKGEDTQRFHSDKPLAYLVSRDKFDYYLVEKAKNAGTEIHTLEPVIDIEENPEGIKIKTKNQRYTTRYVIGADGIPSFIARRAFSTKKRNNAYWTGIISEIGAEWKIPGKYNLDGAIYIHFGDIPSGYGWIFPKKNRYTIGIAGYQNQLKHPQQIFNHFLETQSILKNIKPDKLSIHLVPVYNDHAKVQLGNRTLLAGDAAGLVDPFLGEGIYYAIRSGQIAAQTIRKVFDGKSLNLEEYQSTIKTEFGGELKIAQILSDALYRVPALSYHLFKSNPIFFDTHRRVLSGEISYTELYSKVKTRVSSIFNLLQS